MIVSVNTTLFACVAPTAKSLGVYGSGAETVSVTPSSQVIVSPNARSPATGDSGCSGAGSAPGSSGAGCGNTGTSGIASSITSPTDPIRKPTNITMPATAAMIEMTSPMTAGHFAPRRNSPMSESTNATDTKIHAKPAAAGRNTSRNPTIATRIAMMPTTFGPGFDGSVNGCPASVVVGSPP